MRSGADAATGAPGVSEELGQLLDVELVEPRPDRDLDLEGVDPAEDVRAVGERERGVQLERPELQDLPTVVVPAKPGERVPADVERGRALVRDSRASALEREGHSFEFRRLGTEEFNEAGLRTPGGHLLIMMEARTWSSADTGSRDCVLGRCTKVVLDCDDVGRTRAFFEAAGLLPEDDEPAGHLLHAPGLTLALRQRSVRAPVATLRYQAGNPDTVPSALATLGLSATPLAGGCVLRAPEGTHLLLG